MPLCCSAFRCYNRPLKAGEKTGVNDIRLFHRFPLTKGFLLEKWLLAVRRENWVPCRQSYLCSDHFVESDYCHGFGAKKRLKLDAVPSKFNFISSKPGRLSKVQRDFVSKASNIEKSKNSPSSLSSTSNYRRIVQKQLEAVGEVTREEFFAFINGTTPKQNIEDCTITSCDVIPDDIPTSEYGITAKQEIEDSTITSSEGSLEECFSFIIGGIQEKDAQECAITDGFSTEYEVMVKKEIEDCTSCDQIPEQVSPIEQCSQRESTTTSCEANAAKLLTSQYGITVKEEIENCTSCGQFPEQCSQRGSTTTACQATAAKLSISQYGITVKEEIENCTSCGQFPEQCSQRENTATSCQATAVKLLPSQYSITVKEEIENCTSCGQFPEQVSPIEQCSQRESTTTSCQAIAAKLPSSQYGITVKKEIEDFTSCEGIPEDAFPAELCTQTDSSSRTCQAFAEEFSTSEYETIVKQDIEDCTVTTSEFFEIEQCTHEDHTLTRRKVRHRYIQTDEVKIEPPREKKLQQKINALKNQRYRLRKKLEKTEAVVKVLKKKCDGEMLYHLLDETFEGQPILPILKSQVENAQKLGTQRRYSHELKEFALGLHDCSPKAYSFLRKYLFLPHNKLVGKWKAKASRKAQLSNGLMCSSTEETATSVEEMLDEVCSVSSEDMETNCIIESPTPPFQGSNPA